MSEGAMIFIEGNDLESDSAKTRSRLDDSTAACMMPNMREDFILELQLQLQSIMSIAAAQASHCYYAVTLGKRLGPKGGGEDLKRHTEYLEQ